MGGSVGAGSVLSGSLCSFTVPLKEACGVARILNWFCKFPGVVSEFLRVPSLASCPSLHSLALALPLPVPSAG